MRHATWLLGVFVVLGGCTTRTVGGVPVPGGPSGDVVIVGGEGRGRDGGANARSARVPPGHQPPPGRCASLVGRVPFGAFLLFNDKAWDTEYDWRREASRRPGSVPDIVLRIMSSLVRN